MRFVAPKRSEAKGVTLMDHIKESSSCLLQFIENVVVGERGIAIDADLVFFPNGNYQGEGSRIMLLSLQSNAQRFLSD